MVAFQGAQSTSEEHTFFFVVSHIPLLLLHKTGRCCMCPHLLVLLGMYYRTTLGEAGAFIMTPLWGIIEYPSDVLDDVKRGIVPVL